MLADGRLHMTAVDLLAPHLAPDNAAELLAGAAHKSRAGIELMLAQRFPQPDLPTLITPVAAAAPPSRLSPEAIPSSPHQTTNAAPANSFPSPATVMHKVAPLAPERYAVQCTVDQGTFEKLKYAQELLGHSVPSGELAQVLDRALDALIEKLERQKFAKTDRPRVSRYGDDARHVPAGVKRAVWERDGGRCTFVGESGHRCESRTHLELDHVEPVANGGHATVQGLRLRCRAHNQLAAERAFGRDFMNSKRGNGPRPAAGAA
jgi:5-methylcytosine-specific restriction endonuclease McrA